MPVPVTHSGSSLLEFNFYVLYSQEIKSSQQANDCQCLEALGCVVEHRVTERSQKPDNQALKMDWREFQIACEPRKQNPPVEASHIFLGQLLRSGFPHPLMAERISESCADRQMASGPASRRGSRSRTPTSPQTFLLTAACHPHSRTSPDQNWGCAVFPCCQALRSNSRLPSLQVQPNPIDLSAVLWAGIVNVLHRQSQPATLVPN